jgi:hypothetical protein
MSLADLKFQVRRLLRLQSKTRTSTKSEHDYAGDPVGYAHDILRIDYLTPVQEKILEALHEPPYRVLVPSGHNVGKTRVGAIALNYWFDSFRPSLVISTAPTEKSLIQTLWKEVRVLRNRAGLPGLMPRAAEMNTAPDHLACGFTARDATTFQGRHDERILFLFDEAVAIDPVFWAALATMFQPNGKHACLATFNPTDPSSQAYHEDHSTDEHGYAKWRTFRLSSLEHPNIAAELAGLPVPVPPAVSVAQINDWVYSQGWCDPVDDGDVQPTDIEWPPPFANRDGVLVPGSGRWFRPGPEFQARCLGMWPSGGTYSVWSELVWRLCCDKDRLFGHKPEDLPELGCDCARGGADYTSIHVRWGRESVHHQSANGWTPTKILDRLIELADIWAAKVNAERGPNSAPISGKQIAIKIDDDGTGDAVSDFGRRKGYRFVQVSAGTLSASGRYPNKRSELWFQTAAKAGQGMVGLAKLPEAIRNRMWQQAHTIQWAMNRAGQREIEPKDFTKEKIGRSPDDLDALNLAYFDDGSDVAKYVQVEQEPRRGVPETDRQGRRKLFGG